MLVYDEMRCVRWSLAERAPTRRLSLLRLLVSWRNKESQRKCRQFVDEWVVYHAMTELMKHIQETGLAAISFNSLNT